MFKSKSNPIKSRVDSRTPQSNSKAPTFSKETRTWTPISGAPPVRGAPDFGLQRFPPQIGKMGGKCYRSPWAPVQADKNYPRQSKFIHGKGAPSNDPVHTRYGAISNLGVLYKGKRSIPRPDLPKPDILIDGLKRIGKK